MARTKSCVSKIVSILPLLTFRTILVGLRATFVRMFVEGFRGFSSASGPSVVCQPDNPPRIGIPNLSPFPKMNRSTVFPINQSTLLKVATV